MVQRLSMLAGSSRKPHLLLGLLLAAAWACPAALAESASVAGGTGQASSARIEFRINIPKFLSLQVGSAGAAVDEIALAPTAQQLATTPSTAVDGTGGQSNGAVAVTVQATPGSDVVNLTYRTTDSTGAARPALSDGSSAIPWDTVKVSTSGANAASLTHPAALADGSAADVSVVAPMPKVAGIINLSATWKYSWDDGSNVYPASAPGGFTGRVAYKLSTP